HTSGRRASRCWHRRRNCSRGPRGKNPSGKLVLKAVRNIRKIGALLVVMAASALAQETKVYQEGNYWVEETRGTISNPKSVKLVTDFGAMRFQGTGSQELTYVVRKRIAAGSEEQAKRAFAEFGVVAGGNGDWAWVKGICKSTNRRTRVSVDFNVQGPKALSNL